MTYVVYHETANGRDGESVFNDRTDADIRFDELSKMDGVCNVELSILGATQPERTSR